MLSKSKYTPKNKIKVLIFRSITYLPAVLVLGVWGAMQVMGQMSASVGESGGVAYMAHLGGFAVGVVVAGYLIIKRRVRA